ncbi:hypothetical protein N3K66_005722 [Trichothecium roseum]|uniref:Uncharacterized protein n=1 Tax=Trichothecium roseum TaxID=47278 RepID=A0ACC0UZ68_9HYPO|nr:hypothetical protein N3K66_005722 [Trichothecium roseum]
MDPARRAMIEGPQSPQKRDPTRPRHDPSTRVSKRSRPNAARPTKNSARYMTEDEQSRQFVAEEDKFVLKQSKKKADIRVREGRAKPIDFLAFNLRFIDAERDVFDDEGANVELEVPAPLDVVQNLNAAQLTELESDIHSYTTLETNTRNREYWKALRTLCSDRRSKLNPGVNEERVVSSVAGDIDKILAPKTHEQLEALEKQIKTKLDGDEDIDTDYWEQLLRSLRVWKAKANLKIVYEAIVQSRGDHIKESGQGGITRAATQSTSAAGNGSSGVGTAMRPGPSATSWAQKHQAEAQSQSQPPGTARFSQSETENLSQAANALYDREVARGVSENEEVFTAEEEVTNTDRPQWADKHRPRKPKYFNRVQMGYEWNKYNQTHYDHDNPPPKVVQGYKFNIFYPELIDKTKAPTFKIIREHGRRRGESYAAAGEEDSCLIRFIAGPPYEDVAFRIVDREWDYSAKRDRGFRSSFDKGILQLHFQFKKIFYRK